MKIAAVTDDGTTIHSHFGQAPFFEVLTIENNAISLTNVTFRRQTHQSK